MKNNKGFTLVEILAVLTILAFVVLITVPSLTNILNKSKEKTKLEQYNLIIDATKKYISEYNIEFDFDNQYILSLNTLKKSEFLEDRDYYDIITNKKLESAYIFINKEIDNYSYKIINDYNELNQTSAETCFIYSNGTISGYDNTKDSCTNMENITFPTYIDGNKIKNIIKPINENQNYISEDTKTINFNNVVYLNYIDEAAFYIEFNNPTIINDLDLSNNINLIKIGKNAFKGSPNFKINSIKLPNGLIEIGKSAFQNNNIKELKIPDSLNTIGMYAFSTNKLKTLDIPKNVMNLDAFAFEFNELDSVTLYGKNTFDEFDVYFSNVFGDNSPKIKFIFRS